VKNLYFPKRIPEPKAMEQMEHKVFEKLASMSYKRWFVPIIDDVLKQTSFRKGVIVDIGSGPGLLVREFAKRSINFNVIGVDISKHAISIGKKNTKGLKNTSFIYANANHLPFDDLTIDVVIAKDSLHEFKNPKQVLKEMLRITKKGGIIYIQDLRRDLPWYLLQQAIPPKSILQCLQYYSARASYTKKEIRIMLKKIGVSRYKIRTRNLTKSLIRKYRKVGVSASELRASFQARYVLIIQK